MVHQSRILALSLDSHRSVTRQSPDFWLSFIYFRAKILTYGWWKGSYVLNNHPKAPQSSYHITQDQGVYKKVHIDFEGTRECQHHHLENRQPRYEKGQINSEWIYEAINFPKNDPKNLKDFCSMHYKNSQQRNTSNFWVIFCKLMISWIHSDSCFKY